MNSEERSDDQTELNEFNQPELFDIFNQYIFIIPLWSGLIIGSWFSKYACFNKNSTVGLSAKPDNLVTRQEI